MKLQVLAAPVILPHSLMLLGNKWSSFLNFYN